MQYPSDWNLEENKNYSDNDIEVVTFSSQVSEDVTISVDKLDDNRTTLAQYINDSVLSDLRQSPNFILLQSNTNAILAGNPAYSITYTDKDPDPFKATEIVTIENGKAYDISYTADLDRYDSILPTIQAMINSFSIS